MIPSNHYSPLAFFPTDGVISSGIARQHKNKSYTLGDFPIIASSSQIPPFQLITEAGDFIAFMYLVDAETGSRISDVKAEAGVTAIDEGTFSIISCDGGTMTSLEVGKTYHIELLCNSNTYVSETFCVRDTSNMIKVEYYHNTIFELHDDTYFNYGNNFKHFFYINAEIARPRYEFVNNYTINNGIPQIKRQSSKKVHSIFTLANEPQLDFMRIIQMHDFITIYDQKYNERYDVDEFLIIPEWKERADVAEVVIEFTTGTVVATANKGYGITQSKDYDRTDYDQTDYQ